MIKLDISTAVTVYLILSVVIVLLFWAFAGRRERDRLKTQNMFIWHCSICTLTYVDSAHTDMSRCPRCSSLNKREDLASLK